MTSPKIGHMRAAVNGLAAVADFLVVAGTDAADSTVGAADIPVATLPILMQLLVGKRRGEISSRRRIT